jgi:hypothetical protein
MTNVRRPPSEEQAAAALTRRIRRLENPGQRLSAIYYGTRTDLASPTHPAYGPRVTIGLLSDGSYGIERWTSAGVRTTPTWS